MLGQKIKVEEMDLEAVDAAKAFIASSSRLSERERSQIWAEALHYARLGEWSRFPQPLSKWLHQVVSYIDDDGPKPDYWPESVA